LQSARIEAAQQDLDPALEIRPREVVLAWLEAKQRRAEAANRWQAAHYAQRLHLIGPGRDDRLGPAECLLRLARWEEAAADLTALVPSTPAPRTIPAILARAAAGR
jgi:hypothetical protein